MIEHLSRDEWFQTLQHPNVIRKEVVAPAAKSKKKSKKSEVK